MATRVEVEYFLSYIRSDLVLFDRMFSIFARPQETWQETFLHAAERRENGERNKIYPFKGRFILDCPV